MEYQEAIEQLALAKALETQAKEIKASVAKAMLPKMRATKETYTDSSGGKLIYVDATETERLNVKLAKTELLSRGVSPTTVADSFVAATTTSLRGAYIRYQEPKISEKKGK